MKILHAIRCLFVGVSIVAFHADARTLHGSGLGGPSSPTISSISPASGSTLGGTPVAISGTNFTGATLAQVGGVTCTSLAVISSTLINCTTGANSAGLDAVAVTTSAGIGVTGGLYTYAVPAPVVSSISPGAGTTAGGTPVTIVGLNFTGASAVTIGGNACGSLSVVSSNQITCTTSAGSAGASSVLVTNSYGTNTANALFTYGTVVTPAVTSIFPTSGSASGGTYVSIQGSGFTGASGATVGGVALTGFSVTSDTLSSGVTGAGTSGAVSVVVTNAAGSNGANTLYTYDSPPALIEAMGYDTSASCFHYTKAMSVANSPTIASALAAHSCLYLDSFTDYSTTGGGGCSALTVSSNQRIFGDLETTLCPVTVAAGATGSVLANFSGAAVLGQTGSPGSGARNLTFGAGASINGNLFIRLDYQFGGSPDNTGVGTAGVTLEKNIFLRYRMGFAINDASSGDIYGNWFVQGENQSQNVPFINFTGNTTTPSYGNVFLWYQCATPGGRCAYINGLQDFTIVGIDAEQWDVNRVFGSAGIGDLFDLVNPTKDVRVIGSQGEDPNNAAQPYFRIDANRFLLMSDISGSQWQHSFVGSDVTEATYLSEYDAYFNLSAYAHAVGSSDCVGGAPATTCPLPGTNNTYWGGAPVLVGGNGGVKWPGYPTALTSGQLSALQDSIIGMTTGRTGAPWPAPTYEAPPDPAGPNWNVGLSGQPDSSGTIQALINAATSSACTVLAPGLYYIASPLTLSGAQCLHGSGWGNTAIICKTNTIDAFQGAGGQYTYGPNNAKYDLTDLTIEGCLNGIHWNGLSSTGSGGGQQYGQIFLSHLNMRNIASACLFEDGIYSMDNNLIDYFNCIDSTYGFYELASPTYGQPGDSGEAIGSAYSDKAVWWHCQFIGDVLPLNIPAQRTNNLNMFAESLFENNTGGVAKFSNTLTQMFVNDDFVNNAGDSNNALFDGADNQGALLIGSRIQMGSAGNGVTAIRGNMSVEGTTFQLDGATTAAVWSGTETLTNMYNSYSQDVPLGTINGGFFANNYFPLDSTHSIQYGYEASGTFNAVLPTAVTSQPQEQLLFGPALGFRY
jgi:hypothetical protein